MTEDIKDNETICSMCGKKCNDNKETKFDGYADGYCKDCYKEKYGQTRHIFIEDDNGVQYCMKCGYTPPNQVRYDEQINMYQPKGGEK